MKKYIVIILLATAFYACNEEEKIELEAKNENPIAKEELVLAKDFALNNLAGDYISLSSLRGKVILVDFWASWCGPCRRESPNLVKAYNKYKDQGFDILSVSLDGVPQQQNARQDWINAIKSDGLIWKNHISDLKGWKSSVVQSYSLSSIPATVLVDKEGYVIAKNLRGKELENKLASIFN